jgi:hypothetical protein
MFFDIDVHNTIGRRQHWITKQDKMTKSANLPVSMETLMSSSEDA